MQQNENNITKHIKYIKIQLNFQRGLIPRSLNIKALSNLSASHTDTRATLLHRALNIL